MENNKTKDKKPRRSSKKGVDHHRRGNNNQIIWSAVTRRRAPALPVTYSFGKKKEKKLRGEQEDTRDDPDERRVNVYSFNTDKYSYVSAARI